MLTSHNLSIIEHQFKNKEFYLPNWEVEYLFVGTFNPSGGEKVSYYYGRKRNRFWKLLSEVFKTELIPDSIDFFEKLKRHKIGCVDLINSVQTNGYDLDKITGKGFKDSNIINSTVERIYNTQSILSIIENNEKIKVYSTWGKGPKLKEWREEVEKIPMIINLPSPSPAARVEKGFSKLDYVNKKWKELIFVK